MTAAQTENEIRHAALRWLLDTSLDGTIPLTRDQLANDFLVQGERFPLIDRGRGIRKPARWQAALSITTAVPKSGGLRPYEDVEGVDGLHRYKLRRDERGSADNAGLRAALFLEAPIAWFYGIAPSLFQVIAPVYLRSEEPDLDQFALALTESQRMASPGSIVEERLRQYLISETKRRLHQPVFASQVMLAYADRCAVCALNHRELLDAAHIVPDSKPHGLPIVTNGLALCKIHHAAYDSNILGIRPDYVVQIHDRLLYEIDGPMLQHGLQSRHGQRLMSLPIRTRDLPDLDRLAERFDEFKAS
ncbi:putative restriction endonuclease [Nakamurella panacisegetis]|uniref:Putative restriction endonuclease n=1 Tax=Nakamurella panacisegetis TaxID=1090615 RepID=A0A1H0PP93_9ACTN|nr:HNH endonuclease [Nakamurella panacisegetis]SDP06399.1 putative restriction endonuclease [Nakamurella panacisegetis]